MATKPKLSILIVNYNEGSYLRYCVESIYASAPSCAYEVIVVDNASSDGSVEMLSESFPDVRVIASSDNRGFAGGNNMGFTAAEGDFVLILNPDTIVLPRCLDLLVSYMEAHPNVGAVGPWIRDREPDILGQTGCPDAEPTADEVAESLAQYTVRKDVRIRERWVNTFGRVRIPLTFIRMIAPAHTNSERPVRVDWVLNCASLIRRADVDREFLMDETWFIGTEEIELCCGWLRSRGREFVILPKAQIVHFGGRSYEGRADWAAQLHPLMHAAIYARRTEIFGSTWARIDSLVAFLDHLALYVGLWCLDLARYSQPRREMMAVYRILMRVNLRLFARGSREATAINGGFRAWVSSASEARQTAAS
jgi:GT2 family glycosyltransferase